MDDNTLKACRVCRGSDFRLAFDAGEQVLTGRFPKDKYEEITSGPLKMVSCNGCGLVQLGHHYDFSEMYGETYGYRSGLNLSMVAHLKENIELILSTISLDDDDLILDIGSNDGTSLGMYPEGKYELVGVDPSAVKFSEFYRSDIGIIGDFFNKTSLQKHIGLGKKAKVITSFSMFYDLEDPVSFAEDVSWALREDGVWLLEQSYLPTMLETRSFDTICHEHLEYYTLGSIDNILTRAGLKIADVKFNDTNGGSILVTACKETSSRDIDTNRISRILKKERQLGLDDCSAFDRFRSEVEREKNSLMSFLTHVKDSGERVCALGASTKGNVLLQYYGISSELVESVGEVNPDKYGCVTPGTHIPIIPQFEVLESNPEYLLVLPWHFREFFLTLPLLKGRKLIFPLPKFEIVEV